MSTGLGTNAIQWAALTGIVLPPLAGIVQKEEWRKGDDRFNSIVNALVFGVCCIASAFLVAYLDRSEWDWANWRQTLVAIVFAGIGSFKLYWKPAQAVSAFRAAGPISSKPAAEAPAAESAATLAAT